MTYSCSRHAASLVRFLSAFTLLVAFAQAANKPNVILVTLDSVRTDRLGARGARPSSTPSLDSLAKQSLVFERAYGQVPSAVASHAGMLTGTYPQTNQVNDFGTALAPALPYLPALFKAKGYRTAAVTASLDLDPRSGQAQGFDRGFDSFDAGARRRGALVTARAIAWIERNSSAPFFLWIHLTDAAAPREGSYDAAVATEDAAFGKLLTALRQKKLFDDAVMAVAADHGESLGAHGEDSHGVFLYDETLHVPLLLKLPQNGSAGSRVSTRVRLLDLAPSLLEAAGIAVPAQMQGQSLLRIAKAGAAAEQPVYSRSDFGQRGFSWSVIESWRAGKYLYIRAPKPELYDLSADPGATRNLAQSSKATLDTMAAQMEAFTRRLTTPTSQATTTRLSSTEMQKLASLGYVGLQKTTSSSAGPTGTDPKDAIADANRILGAMDLMTQGKLDRAAIVLQNASHAMPNAYLAQFALGTVLNQQKQFAKAIAPLHRAIELQPESPWAHFQIGRALLKTGDAKTAAVHLAIASARLPKFAAAHVNLAEAYAKLGRTEDAKRERALLESHP